MLESHLMFEIVYVFGKANINLFASLWISQWLTTKAVSEKERNCTEFIINRDLKSNCLENVSEYLSFMSITCSTKLITFSFMNFNRFFVLLLMQRFTYHLKCFKINRINFDTMHIKWEVQSKNWGNFGKQLWCECSTDLCTDLVRL